MHLKDSWKNFVDDVKKMSEGKFVFAIQTDTHIDFDNSSGKNWSPDDAGLNLKEFAKETGIDFYANLGDIIEGYPNDNFADMSSDMDNLMERYTKDAPCPVIIAYGNHDSNHMWADKHGGDIITNDELYRKIIIPIKSTSDKFVFAPQGSYYYIDFEKVRVIVLNTQDAKTTAEFKISDEQIKWIYDVALKTDKALIVMSHTPLAEEISLNKIEGGEKALSLFNDFSKNGGCIIGFFYGHQHTQSNCVKDGFNHICFSNLGTRAEVVAVDFEKREILTKCVGDVAAKDDTIKDRKFSF